MSTFKPLKALTSRRQVLKAGLAALTLTGIAKQAQAKEESSLKTSNGHSKPKTKKAGAKRLVMLDPGHGGIDTGAIGRNGSKEKHVVLAIAKNVRAILRSNGIDARLTRTGDTFIPLYDRVEIAHKHGADLFMSIHADGFTNPSAAGASVFALSNRGASSAMAKYLSDRENRAGGGLLPAEGAAKDGGENRRQGGDVPQADEQAGGDPQQRHKGNDPLHQTRHAA